MLHIVQQFMFGLTGMLKCELGEGVESGGNINNEIIEGVNAKITTGEKISKNLNTDIKKYLQLIDKNNNFKLENTETEGTKAVLQSIIDYVNSKSSMDSQFGTSNIDRFGLEGALDLLTQADADIANVTENTKNKLKTIM